MLTYSHFFFSISLSLFFFCMSDYIFILSDQNSDLAGHMSLQKKKNYFQRSDIYRLRSDGEKFADLLACRDPLA